MPTLDASQDVKTNWFSASCQGITQETADTFSYEFIPTQTALSHFSAGAHITVRLPAGPNGAMVNRTYTLSSSPKTLPRFQLTVKQVKGGQVSNWLAENLHPGMTLEFTQAEGDFILPEQPPGRILFIAAGSGITPVMSMLRFLSDTANKSEIDLLYYARSAEDIIFREELDALCKKMKGLRLHYCIEAKSSDWQGLDGRICAQHLEQFNKLPEHEIFLCGPSPFMNAATSALQAFGVADYQIHKEVFALDLSDISIQTQAKLQFTGETSASKLTKKTILDEAESRGISLASGCRSGICKTCRCKKLSGETVNLVSGQRSNKANEYILACVTQAVSDTVIQL
ncbi:MAG: flavin reductase family protein [Oleiphilus sp.]